MGLNLRAKYRKYAVGAVAVLMLPALFAYSGGNAGVALAAAAMQTASCSGTLTPALTEGPYYKAGSPERASLLEAGMSGTKIVISGTVFDKNCRPITGAWLDFWQADSSGAYDNAGYKLRGHQFTDASG